MDRKILCYGSQPTTLTVLISFSQEADNDPTGEAAANTQQTLTFYELDLGLNHVVRKYSEALEEHGNFLITGKRFFIFENFDWKYIP